MKVVVFVSLNVFIDMIRDFVVIIGDFKDSSSAQKPVQFQAAFVMQSAPQAYGGHLELGFGQPDVVKICT